MSKSLRKHVLSEYAVIKKDMPYYFGPTVLTENIEVSDPDEFILKNDTGLTHAVEISDPDEFKMLGSVLTKSIEISDPDELRMDTTECTFTVETSDEDEFLLM